jgi:hypothetical protein
MRAKPRRRSNTIDFRYSTQVGGQDGDDDRWNGPGGAGGMPDSPVVVRPRKDVITRVEGFDAPYTTVVDQEALAGTMLMQGL